MTAPAFNGQSSATVYPASPTTASWQDDRPLPAERESGDSTAGIASALAVIVLAHTDSAQVRRLVHALDPFPVFLHCDSHTTDEEFAEMTADLPERCRVLPRIRTGWARWENVQAELDGYRAALAETDATHFALLSGADYPVAPPEVIAATLAPYLGRTLAMLNPMPYPEWGRSGGLDRLRYRHWAFRKHMLRLPIPRRLPPGVSMTGGSQMKVISREHAQAVVTAADTRPELVKFWKRSWIPDETFVPSILMSPQFVPDWEEMHLRFTPWMIVWDGPRQKSPPWLTMEHFDTLAEMRQPQESEIGILFARKLSSDHSADLLDAIDTRLRNRAPLSPISGEGDVSVDLAADVSTDRAGDDGAAASVLTPSEPTPTPVPATVPTAAKDNPAIPATASPVNSGLFGRGMLYVIVWSLQLVAGTVVSPILAHLLGVGEFGGLASGIALFQVLSVLALLGLDQAVILQKAEDGDDNAARGLVAVGIGISSIVTLAVAIAAPLWSHALGFGYFSPLVLAVILWTAPGAAVQVMLALLLAQDRLRAFSIVSALSAVGGQVIGLALLVLVHRDAVTYAWGGVFSQFAAMFLALALTKPKLSGLVNWPVTWRAIKLGIPLALGSLAFFVLNAGDRLVIQRLLGAEAVGRYQVAYVVGSVVILLLTFTSSAWIPRIAAIKDPAERWKLSSDARDGLYRLLAPVIIGITLGAPVALRIVAPSSYAPEGLLIVVLLVALAAFPVAESGATTRLLITLRRGRSIAVIAGVAAVLNVALNIVLVPMLGIAGSALATLVSFTLLAVLQARVLPAVPVWRGPSFRLGALVAVCVLVASASVLLPQSEPFNIGRFVVALCCLPWFLHALRTARGA
ncbi:MAG: hypothetical protein JWQ43_1769 [Glaciihabitans sp.]|nr:hypothetical protein [Glaciihabitans sp.]